MVAGLAGHNFLIQAKSGAGASFTPAELDFEKSWRGAVVNLESKEAAIEWATRTRHELRRRSASYALMAAVCDPTPYEKGTQ